MRSEPIAPLLSLDSAHILLLLRSVSGLPGVSISLELSRGIKLGKTGGLVFVVLDSEPFPKCAPKPVAWDWRGWLGDEEHLLLLQMAGFVPQHLHGSSRLSVTPLPGFQHPLLTSVGTRQALLHIKD